MRRVCVPERYCETTRPVVRYVGIAALAATFWLLVATVRLIRVSAPERCVPTSVTPPADRAPQVQKVRPDDFDPFGIDPRPSPRENPISKAALITGLNGVRTRVAYCYQKYKVVMYQRSGYQPHYWY